MKVELPWDYLASSRIFNSGKTVQIHSIINEDTKEFIFDKRIHLTRNYFLQQKRVQEFAWRKELPITATLF